MFWVYALFAYPNPRFSYPMRVMNRGLDLCLRGSTDSPFCLDDQNHNWTAKSNAVLFLYAYMDLYLDLLGEPYAFPHLMAILVLEMPPT